MADGELAPIRLMQLLAEDRPAELDAGADEEHQHNQRNGDQQPEYPTVLFQGAAAPATREGEALAEATLLFDKFACRAAFTEALKSRMILAT